MYELRLDTREDLSRCLTLLFFDAIAYSDATEGYTMADNGTDFIEMTLANVVDGELEAQFQEELMKVLDVRAMLGAYKEAGGVVSCAINMSVGFSFHIESGAVIIDADANFKAPKRKPVARAAFVKNGQVLVENAVQTNLLDNVTPIDRVKEGDPK